MTNEEKERILEELNKDEGYSKNFRDTVVKLLSELHFYYELHTIFCNSSIINNVDRIMCRYSNFRPVACTWRDIGPAPFDCDYMASYLDDYDHMVVILQHPMDNNRNIGVHITECGDFGEEKVGYRFDNMEFETFVSEEEIMELIDDIVSQW